MKTRRLNTLDALIMACGELILKALAGHTGWPAHAVVSTPSGPVHVDLHVGSVGTSGRGRDHVERRFQNPGKNKPVRATPGHFPLLVGLWSEQDGPVVCVGMDALRRVGDQTRKSLFVPLALYDAAQQDGWAEHISTSGERLVVFLPSQLPRYVQVRIDEAEAAAAMTRLRTSGL
jgi:hypothetical protein